jgi:hypothetical protein
MDPNTISIAIPNESAEMARFRDSFFGDPYMAWHDGLDFGALLSLQGGERDLAEKLLLESDDSRAIEGLGALQSLKAIEKVGKVVEGAVGQYQVKACQALNKIKPDPELAKPIIQVLKSANFWNDRMEAAMALRDFRDKETRKALLEAVAKDPDYLVRHHAANSLLRLCGYDSEVSEFKGIFPYIISKVDEPPTEEDYATFSKAASVLERMFVDYHYEN